MPLTQHKEVQVRFNFEATGIGSVPFNDAKTACRFILEQFSAIPFWPQLPRRSFRENMYVQYAEGLPGAIIDDEKKTIHIDIEKAMLELEEAYTACLDSNVERFSMSPAHAEGLYAFCDMACAHKERIRYVKGGVTGPVSFGLFVTDEKKVSIVHHKDIFEVITKSLVMKARWQARMLKRITDNVIMFIDEPYLVSIGSSFVAVNVEEVMAKVDELADALHEEGALVGVHCCGNTDWPLVLKRRIDILNFDAYSAVREFLLYGDDIRAFIGRGGTIAWGIVPSSDEVKQQSAIALAARLNESLAVLEKKGIDRAKISSLVTPSCGVGTLDEEVAKKVLRVTKALSEELMIQNSIR